MANKRKITTAYLWMIAGLQLWGGTGRPSDGFLFFILLLGFLLLLLGILQLAAHVKKRILEVLDDLF